MSDITATSLQAKSSVTIGGVILEKAINLARYSAERAITHDWKHTPMFGIEVNTDKWALEFQKELVEIKKLLKLDTGDYS